MTRSTAPPVHDPSLEAPALTPESLLRSIFGFEGFRGQQQAVIDHVLDGGDCLVLMPTGGGKSLCYQIPSILREGVGVVVSPLIALMQNQVETLRQAGVRAAAINASIHRRDIDWVMEEMVAGRLDLVYVAPERLLTEGFLRLLEQCRLALFAIDEAHCVSQWGHDFRPEYLKLSVLHERFPDVPRFACTATADGPTRKDILERLDLTGGRLFVSGFDRPNIRYRIQAKTSGIRQLYEFIRTEHAGDSGIVYCMSRRRVEEIAGRLERNGIPALPYHAGLDSGLRTRHQDRFLKEDGLVMVATIAFGMGIDKPNVRFVAHYDLPKSLEAYYQETGRAGRDGLAADAFMLYGFSDVARIRQLVEGSEAADQQKSIERRKLDALLGYCETTGCRRQVLLAYFGDDGTPCGNCDTCLEPPQTFDGTEAAQKALSCVYRTGQMFGAGHLIDVLVGAETERIRDKRHDRLSTYGIGREFKREEWRSIFRQLVALGLLVVDMTHGGLALSPDCRPVLRGERRIRLRQDKLTRSRAKSTDQTGGPGQSPPKAARRALPDDPEIRERFDSLRARRLELARAQGVPPYVIFHDTTLIAIAEAQPRTLAELARLPGIGEAKLSRYGRAVLDTLAGRPAPASGPGPGRDGSNEAGPKEDGPQEGGP